MRKNIAVLIFASVAGIVFSASAFAQTEAPPPGWKTCPHCLTREQAKEEDLKVNNPGIGFNPRDLSGVWNSRPDKVGPNTFIIDTVHDAFAKDQNGTGIRPPNLPNLTPYGKKVFDATRTDFQAPDGTRVTNSKDGMLKCDPLGWPRQFGYNYGIEFVMLPDRVLQFIEWGHTWRTIWTDGRKLPENPPEPRWYGWSVGHWEPDNTFVVESTGFDDRSWISEAGNFSVQPGSKGWGMAGWPHSDEMKLVERWKRASYGILEATITVIDPKVYDRPWTTDVVQHTLLPDTEIWEYFCVPSDNQAFNDRVLIPSNGAPVPKK